ncbi:aminodeoxychorismate/anthranilate synthase component II [Kocuria coralli]|uniref:Aminodeoxychorismate/anthranilate synthase component II n=1 Tax=Kocuria coralli TaxID=1461025 RepID=A0A5J5KUM6_9MICC|nr:aminodeoxychorismate/anthranilate synthase component II [Kocuria coralli]KAA9392920.1 aminodeoxychorismate/anthranilate synthase component II [Kocuria coralli]
MTVKVLVVDNYDSFVYTLVGYLEELGASTTVIRNDELDDAAVRALADEHRGILLSPGPGAPADAGVCAALVLHAEATGKPLLGVCLGHQTLAEVYGGTVAHAVQLMHGKTSEVVHGSSGLFEGVDSPFTATRYHSLSVVPDTVPGCLEVSAVTDDGAIMGLTHRKAPLYGVQFHPESVLTQGGYRMLGNWLELCGLEGAAAASAKLSPLITR